jgi:Zn-dependent protease with chaperone function
VNFFQAQDKARQGTWKLALMFGAAIVTLIILTNILVAIAFGFGGRQMGLTFEESIAHTPADAWLLITLGVIGVVGTASLYKYLSIRAGGKAIAEALGGHLLHQNAADANQRRLLNVVEEMAIASGVPVPPVYLIAEPSINAFAAGFSPQDAVIGINQGTIDHLDRTELQGVVAHEFSHILNGDTNINLRLIAILHGILFLGIIGYGVLRVGGHSRKNGGAMVALGLGLLVIGFGGTFFGRMIKSAVSRQREYLADASAVQFTRDPSSIADALKKIGGLSVGSTMTSKSAEEASHMFFGAALSKFAGGLMSTHPPLHKRILAIEPGWDGQFPVLKTDPLIARSSDAKPGSAELAHGFAQGGFAQANVDHVSATPDSVIEHVGHPTQDSLAVAQTLIQSTDEMLKNAAHDSYEARGLIYAMLLDKDPSIRVKQLSFLERRAEAQVPQHMTRLIEAVDKADRAHLLALIEMSMPALKELSKSQYERFSQNAAELITADDRVDAFEWVMHRLLVQGLYAHFEGPQRHHGKVKSVAKVADDAAKLLSILASHSHDDLDGQLAAYQAGAKELDLAIPFAKQEHFDYQRMNAALANLRKLRPLVKPSIVKACAATVLADNHISVMEGALLQGISATLDCPLPPSIYA